MNDALVHLRKALPSGIPAAPGFAYRVKGDTGARQRVAIYGGTVTKAYKTKFGTAAILTFPGRDMDGDTVNPAGGNWDYTPRVVNLEHEVPVGLGTMPVMKSLMHDGASITVPVGITKWFEKAADLNDIDLRGYTVNRCLSAADQTRAAVEYGAMTGVSMEFQPAGPEGIAYHPTGAWSELARRKAFDFNQWNGLGWAHAMMPKNPNARTLVMDMPAEQLEKCVKIARDGKINNLTLDPIFVKAFAPYAAIDRKTIVRVEKAVAPVDDPNEFEPMPGDPNDVDGDGIEDNTPQTAKAAYDAVQQVSDALANLRGVLAKSEHMKAKAALSKHADRIEKELESMQGVGDMVHNEVNGTGDEVEGEEVPEGDEAEGGDEADTPAEGEGGESETPEAAADSGDESSDAEGEDEEDDTGKKPKPFGKAMPIQRDATGRVVTKSGYVPSRGVQFKASDLKSAAKAKIIDPDEARIEAAKAVIVKAERENKQLKKQAAAYTRPSLRR